MKPAPDVCDQSHLDNVQASDLSFSSDPNAVIPWVVKATLKILEMAASKPSIKRVVLASSSTASYMILPDPNGRQVYQGKSSVHDCCGMPMLRHLDTWNDVAVAAAWDSATPADRKGVSVYAASKAEGERQSWQWIEEHHPQFVFNAVLPCFNVSQTLS